MRSKCINSTSSHKYITANGFREIDFLYDVEILTVQHCFSPILEILRFACSFDYITTSNGLCLGTIFASPASSTEYENLLKCFDAAHGIGEAM